MERDKDENKNWDSSRIKNADATFSVVNTPLRGFLPIDDHECQEDVGNWHEERTNSSSISRSSSSSSIKSHNKMNASSKTTAARIRIRTFPRRMSVRKRAEQWIDNWSFLVGVVAVLFVLLSVVSGSSEDWSSMCPSGCKCTWVSGKKTGDCRASHWSQIPPGLSPEVQVLEMSTGLIRALPKDAFKSVDLTNVQKVLLKSCGIERIDKDAFRELEIMIELDLTGNRITSLDMDTFAPTIRLRELKLRGNPLAKLTGTHFPPLNYLKLMDMNDCELSSLPKRAFEKLGVLETLSLSGNRFVRLNEDVFRPLSKLKSLSLDRNPWKCDCRLKSLRDWVVERKLFTHETKCAAPAHVANFAWDALLSENFACRPEIESVRINGKPTEAFLVHTDIGSDIRLECLVRGNPPPELKWVRDGQVLSNTSRSYGKSYFIHIGEGSDGEGGQAVWVNLTIPRTEAGDAGEYTCVGSNDGGFAEKNLTLNFQDVPSGAGVGLGLGSIGGSGSNDSGWILILVTILTVIVITSLAVTLVVCFCSRKRRGGKNSTNSAKELSKENGRNEDGVSQQTLLLKPTSSPTPEKASPQEELDSDETSFRLLDNSSHGRRTPVSISNPSPLYGTLGLPTPPIHQPPTSVVIPGVHGHHTQPDLLLPHPTARPSSSLSSSTDLLPPHHHHPHTPRLLIDPSTLYSAPPSSVPPPPFLPHFSPTEPVILPGRNRPGYVTLPRRHRVPSWSPPPPAIPSGGAGPPSPTGSAATVSFPLPSSTGKTPLRPKYDNLGPRTTADGSSKLSLNKEGLGQSETSIPSAVIMGGTLGRHSMLRSTPLTPGGGSLRKSSHAPFDPIVEVDAPPEDIPPPPPQLLQQQQQQQRTVPPATSINQGSNGTLGKKVPPKPPPKPQKKNKTQQQSSPSSSANPYESNNVENKKTTQQEATPPQTKVDDEEGNNKAAGGGGADDGTEV